MDWIVFDFVIHVIESVCVCVISERKVMSPFRDAASLSVIYYYLQQIESAAIIIYVSPK